MLLKPISSRRFVLGMAIVLIATACAGRATPPAAPVADKYPDFMYPTLPAALQRAAGAEGVEPAWRFLQSGDTRNAGREFAAVLKRNPQLYPARAGEAYVALARGDHDHALTAFDAALMLSRDYVPALVGRGQTLLAMKREADAIAAFEAALAVDSSLAGVRRRVEVLRFRSVEQVIDNARSAASAGRLDQARTAYERAIQLSPDSAFLYRELAIVELAPSRSTPAIQRRWSALATCSSIVRITSARTRPIERRQRSSRPRK
jgi:tetratricopeptide (TPR) repeat protein